MGDALGNPNTPHHPAADQVSNYQCGKSSSKIEIPLYHQILLCPFKLRPSPQNDPASQGDHDWPLATIAKCLRGNGQNGSAKTAAWKERSLFPADPQEDHLQAGDKPNSKRSAYSRIRFAEYIYFHPAVRSFLYPTADDAEQGLPRPAIGSSAMRVFERTDVRWAKIQWKTTLPDNRTPSSRTILLRVRRMEFYLFHTDVVMLVVEFDNRLGPQADPQGHAGQHPLDTYAQREDRPFDVARGQASAWGFAPTNDRTVSARAGVPRSPLTLQDVLYLQDALRRVHAPYWEYDSHSENLMAGHSIECLHWLKVQDEQPAAPDTARQKVEYLHGSTTAGQPVWSDQPPSAEEWSTSAAYTTIQSTRDRSEPPLLPWWKAVLPWQTVDKDAQDSEPKRSSAGFEDRSATGVQGRLLGDDRAAVMTYVGVEDPRQIGDGDWMRLGLQDAPGEHDRFPYSPDFYGQTVAEAVHAFDAEHAYDRHFSKQQGRPCDDSHTTRLLCSAMGLVAVGQYGIEVKEENSHRSFACDPVTGLLGHFRYHYFKLALILHFQRATLLKLEDDLADGVKPLIQWNKENPAEKEKYIELIQSLGRKSHIPLIAAV